MSKVEVDDIERAVLLDDPENERSPDTPHRLTGFDGIADSDEALEAKVEQEGSAPRERSFTELLFIVRDQPCLGNNCLMHANSVCPYVARHVAGRSRQYHRSGVV